MKKKFLSMFLTLVMVVEVLPKVGLIVNADSEVIIVDKIMYVLNEDNNEATVKEPADKSLEKLRIQEKIVGKGGVEYVVRNIDDGAFAHCKNLKTVEIPDSVTNIGSSAFAWSALETVTIPKYVTTIKASTFTRCRDLGNVIIPTGVTNIEENAFSFCENLENIAIPDSVVTIGKNAFMYSALLSAVLPEGVTEISQGIFSDCCNLKSVKLSNSATAIGNKAFSGCKKLEDIKIPSSVTAIGRAAFMECENLKEIVIPNGVTTIEISTFEGCKLLGKVSIPYDVTFIGDYAFSDCKTLRNIEIPSVTSIGRSVFKGCENLREIQISKEITTIEESTFEDCKELIRVCNERLDLHYSRRNRNDCILSGVTVIKDRAFFGCKSLRNLYLGKNITTIGKAAFKDCSNLRLGDSDMPIYVSSGGMLCEVTTVEESTFEGCKSLQTLIIPKSVRKVRNKAFSGCENLRTLMILSSDIIIEPHAFDFGNLLIQIHTA